MTGDQIGHGLGSTLVGDVQHVGSAHALEQLGRQVRQTAVASGAVADRRGRGLEVLNEFARVVGRHRGVYHQQLGGLGHQRERGEVLERVIRHFGIQRSVDAMRGRGHQQGVTIWCRAHRLLGADVGACAGFVVNQYGLLPFLREFLGQRSGDDVGCAAGWKGNNDAHRAVWIVLRPCAKAQTGGGKYKEVSDKHTVNLSRNLEKATRIWHHPHVEQTSQSPPHSGLVAGDDGHTGIGL